MKHHNVKPKKHLGQHFLKDESICARIAQSIKGHQDYKKILEIGPGTGALTKHLLTLDKALEVVEVDRESIAYLHDYYPDLIIHDQDFLKTNVEQQFGEQVAVVGNFPYNISSQILFKVLEYKTFVPEVVGMFQKEVAVRICEGPGTKKYGILSVFIQAFYDAEYLFTVDEDVFDPPPKVKSGVLRLTRKENLELGCDEKLFFRNVKVAFNQRRKTLSNSLKSFNARELLPEKYLRERPEQLNVESFVEITNCLMQGE